MKKMIYTVVLCLVAMIANAANIYNVRAGADDELKSFFSAVSLMVDDSDPADPEKFADFWSGEVFRFNGKKMYLEDLLVSYRNKVMADERIAHTFTLTSIEKKKDMGNVYKVEGFLDRIPLDDSWKSKRQPVYMEIAYDEDWQSGKKLQILAIKMDTSLVKVFPKEEEAYEFSAVKQSFGRVSCKGGRFDVIVKSTLTRYKTYEGIGSEMIETADVDFTVESSRWGPIEAHKNESNVKGWISANTSHHERNVTLQLMQQKSGKRIRVYFEQEKAPRSFLKFTMTKYDGWNEWYVHYIDKYNCGISYKASIEDSRWCIGFGLLFSPNYWKTDNTEKQFTSLNDGTYTEAGYTVTKKAYAPGDDDYMDAAPYIGEYEQKDLLNGLYLDTGVWLCNFLRLDCGLGWAYHVTRKTFEKANYVEIYEYKKKNSTLPDIANQVHTYGYVKNFRQDDAKHALLVKPGLTLSIPFSESFRMNLSGAYLYLPMIKNMETKWDLSIGFAFVML